MAISTLPPKSSDSVASAASSADLSQLAELPENLTNALNTLNRLYVSVWSQKKNKNGKPKIDPALIDPILLKFMELPDLLFIIHLKYQEFSQEIPDSVINTFIGQDPLLTKNQSLLVRLFTNGVSAILPMVTKKYPADNSVSAINQFVITALTNIITKHKNKLTERETIFFKSLLENYTLGKPTLKFTALSLIRDYLKKDPTGGNLKSRRKFFRNILFAAEREEFQRKKQALEKSLDLVLPEEVVEAAEVTEVKTESELEINQRENHAALLLLTEQEELERKKNLKQTKIKTLKYAKEKFYVVRKYLEYLVDDEEKAQTLLDTLLKEAKSKKKLKK